MNPLPKLYVEGKNDLHVIANLMKMRGVELDERKGPVVIEACDSYVELLESLKVATKANLQRCGVVGFVFDTDREEDHRCEQVKGRLAELGYALLPEDMSHDGIIKKTLDGKIGIWMMPHVGAKTGKLEDFLRHLIPAGNPLLPMADRYVEEVFCKVEPSKRFRDIDKEKAQMTSWLAVQPVPGLPYGSAIAAELLHSRAPLADSLFGWVCRLYDLIPATETSTASEGARRSTPTPSPYT